MPRRTVVHLLTCVLALVTAVALLLASAAIGDAGSLATTAPEGRATTAAVHAFYDAINQAITTGNASAIDAAVAPDAVVQGLPAGATPDRAGLAGYLATLHASVPDASLVVEELVVDGDRAMARVGVEGAGAGRFVGIPLLEAPRVWAAVGTVRVAGGRVVEYRADTTGLPYLEPLGQLSVGNRLPTRPVVVLERLVVPPGRHVEVELAQESRLLYVEAGTPSVRIADSFSEPALLASRLSDGADGFPTEISPGTSLALEPGDLLALPAPARFPIRNDSAAAAEVLVLAVFPPGSENRAVARPDPAFGAGGLPQTWIGQEGTLAPAGKGELVGVTSTGVEADPLAGGRTTSLPVEPAVVALGRATLPGGAELHTSPLAGPALLVVEAGSLVLATDGGEVWVTRAATGASSDLASGTLAAGDGALLQPGTKAVLRNVGTEPLVVRFVSITPEDAGE